MAADVMANYIFNNHTRYVLTRCSIFSLFSKPAPVRLLHDRKRKVTHELVSICLGLVLMGSEQKVAKKR